MNIHNSMVMLFLISLVRSSSPVSTKEWEADSCLKKVAEKRSSISNLFSEAKRLYNKINVMDVINYDGAIYSAQKATAEHAKEIPEFRNLVFQAIEAVNAELTQWLNTRSENCREQLSKLPINDNILKFIEQTEDVIQNVNDLPNNKKKSKDVVALEKTKEKLLGIKSSLELFCNDLESYKSQSLNEQSQPLTESIDSDLQFIDASIKKLDDCLEGINYLLEFEDLLLQLTKLGFKKAFKYSFKLNETDFEGVDDIKDLRYSKILIESFIETKDLSLEDYDKLCKSLPTFLVYTVIVERMCKKKFSDINISKEEKRSRIEAWLGCDIEEYLEKLEKVLEKIKRRLEKFYKKNGLSDTEEIAYSRMIGEIDEVINRVDSSIGIMKPSITRSAGRSVKSFKKGLRKTFIGA